MMAMQRKRASRSHCGVYDCSACALYLEEKCPGCGSGNLHLKRERKSVCAVYQCVRELGIAGCYECGEARCRLEAWSRARCPLRMRLGGERADGFRDLLESTKGAAAVAQEAALAERTAERLCSYLRVVEEYADRGVSTMSSHHLARAVGVRSSLVRRDLSALGGFGVPGRGYSVDLLQEALRRRLRLGRMRPTVWLGAAGLVDQEATRQALEAVQCRVVGLFDDGCEGRAAGGLPVQALARAPREVRKHRATVAVLASEEAARPELVRELVAAGIRAVLNLTAAALSPCAQAVIEQGDLRSQLARLLSRFSAGLRLRSASAHPERSRGAEEQARERTQTRGRR